MSFDKRLFISLSIFFFIFTIVGTLTHEAGHYMAAKYLGYDAKISYDHTHWIPPNPNYIGNASDHIWFTLGGPLETMLTGTIGLIFLFAFRKVFANATTLLFWQWFLIFVSLFWSRQTFNFVVWISIYLFSGRFAKRGDEIKIAHYLQIPEWAIITLTGIIGAFILTIIIFRFVPIKQRVTFIASGLVGGSIGYVLWVVLFGKYLMP